VSKHIPFTRSASPLCRISFATAEAWDSPVPSYNFMTPSSWFTPMPDMITAVGLIVHSMLNLAKICHPNGQQERHQDETALSSS